MTSFDKQRLTEVVLYILNKTKGLDYYHIFKVIYFANMSHLARYGSSLVSDSFSALRNGPVPSALYACIRGDVDCDKELRDMLDACISKGSEDAYYMREAMREADVSYLSKSDIEVLDASIAENVCLSFGELRLKSHGEEWCRAYSQRDCKIMDTIGMARDGKASDAMIEYIKDTLAVEQALL